MSETIRKAVQEKYASVAQSGLSSSTEGVRAVAEAFGYTAEQLASVPADANMGVSCGNPTAFASLKPGEVVVDLGCGGGLDVFLAVQKVGPTGKAIGIDMTPEMLELARRNAAKAGANNVEFHEAAIDGLPLPDCSVDCVISNCVINLAPDKQAVFREIARVLKPGGRLAVSDIALKEPLPPEIGEDLTAYVGCIAGAIPIEEYRRGLIEAGFGEVAVVDSGKPPFVVTLYNERNASVRAQQGGSWGRMVRQGTIAISGFGYFAERAEVDGFTCYNTSLSGKGDRYPDPKSEFLASEDSYILLTFTRNPPKMVVEIKGLDGEVLDRKEFTGK